VAESFYNTIHLAGEELKKAVQDAKSQEAAILLIYLNTRRPYTASDITRLTEKAGRKWVLWSNRRAITNLKKAGDLVKCARQQISPHGKPEHFYTLNDKKHPLP
jgi:hypothetical protein